MKKTLPSNVFEKSGSWYFVRAEGKKRVWIKLCRISEGLPGLYLAMSRLTAASAPTGAMPALIADWQTKVMVRRAATTKRDDIARCKIVAEAFVEFAAEQMTPPAVAEFLGQFGAKPRTFNAYRELIRELMRHAEARGFRAPGSNPVTALRTMPTPARDRYITDSELRRIKVAAMRGKDGKDTRSGPMLCALVDMAYLTGQRIGDLLALQWTALERDGITFKTSKTGAKVRIQWSPKLRDVERRLRALRVERHGFAPQVFTTQDGSAYTYWGASTAWRRACARAGISAHFHDIRAKALTDKERREGMQAARTMGGHSTEQQTSDYVRNRSGRSTGATR